MYKMLHRSAIKKYSQGKFYKIYVKKYLISLFCINIRHLIIVHRIFKIDDKFHLKIIYTKLKKIDIVYQKRIYTIASSSSDAWIIIVQIIQRRNCRRNPFVSLSLIKRRSNPTSANDTNDRKRTQGVCDVLRQRPIVFRLLRRKREKDVCRPLANCQHFPSKCP